MNMVRKHLVAACAAVLALSPLAAMPRHAAPRPPMGWNSWDSYGLTLDEAQYRANVAVLRGLGQLGWRYAVIDEGWYMANPFADRLAPRGYAIDGYGRLLPASARFPSAIDGAGFGALAGWTHAQGLKFGIHIVRGIPKMAVEANMPIEGSSFRATDAADKDATCGWDDGNYGVADNAAGQAYYDSLIGLYARWGVDLLKVDCISDHPYRATEIQQIARAIRKSGRSIVLSLSPGPTNLSHSDEVAQNAQMWRIANDLWDYWTSDHDRPLADVFPTGLRVEFDNISAWNKHVRTNGWPDPDMLPIGSLRPHPGLGAPRNSGLTPDEARTLVTLWSVSRSPLIMGGNLTELDGFTRSLLTNRQVIALDQRDGTSRPLMSLPPGLDQGRVWLSTPRSSRKPDTVAIFNIGDKPLAVHTAWRQLGLGAGRLAACNLWDGSQLRTSTVAKLTVPPHGVALYRIGTAR